MTTSPSQGRGRRVGLSRPVLVAGATELADAEGLDAVTIRRLAQRHGVSPMAIYAHFSDKEALFDALGDAVLAQTGALEGLGGGGHEDGSPGERRAGLGGGSLGAGERGLEDLLTGFVTVLRAHPVLAPLAARRILDCDAGRDVVESVLTRLGEEGHTPREAAAASQFLLNALVALVTGEPGRTAGADDEQAHAQAVRERRARLLALDPARHPLVIAAADVFADCADPETYYADGIRRLVAGVRVKLAR
ncbi:helix-turn-helix domain-containing protein [Streptomyces sp. NPDC004539]|uniref:TetR/AcrR family transcriptional regulator n=1 Tax=Streptomyces sp. NPDC004539 TaxID=3154280 RepID=UPI0033AB7855